MSIVPVRRRNAHWPGTMRARSLSVGPGVKFHVEWADEGIVTMGNPRHAADRADLTGSDVTERCDTQIAPCLEARILQHLPAAVTVTDDKGIVVYWNDRAATMYGLTRMQALGRRIAELHVAPSGVQGDEIMQSVAASGGWEGDYESIRADGTKLPVHMTLEQIVDAEIGLYGIVGHSMDISDRRVLEESLEFQSLHDTVTGLPNRRLFIGNLDVTLARAGRDRKHTAVLSIDLDDFKLINDRIGESAGDRVLRYVGARIAGAVRPGDVVARLGGDEYIVCCDELGGAEEAYAVADRILESLAEPCQVDGRSTRVAASIGIAVSGPDSRADGLLRNADIAMYAAKQSGKGHVELFDDALHNEVRCRRELSIELKKALDRGQIKTLFQPQVCLRTGDLVGFEALARWPHPERGMVSPAEFIPVAEECGLIGQLGRTVLEDSCRALRTWLSASPGSSVKVAVNVSARQLADTSFPDMVRSVFDEIGVDARRVCLEVTESALIDVDVASAALWRLKETGVEIAIDDFGTGYSSLSRLHRFPLDYLKIDGTFVAGMSERTEDAVIVACVLALARGLGLCAIAEGIETNAQLDQLVASGCELGQGWLWSAAIPIDEAVELVREAKPLRAICPTGGDVVSSGAPVGGLHSR